MKKGQQVSMRVDGEYINGVTIEDECGVVGSSNRVIRVKWEDGSESIENILDLF